MSVSARPAAAFLPLQPIDFELAGPAPVVQLSDGMNGAVACVRLHGRPVGSLRVMGRWADVASLRRLVADTMTRSLIDHVIRMVIGRPPSKDPVGTAFLSPLPHGPEREAVTVIVCTRDRGAELAEALDALVASDPACIIVVDNSPDGRSAGSVRRTDRVKVVHEPRPGLDNARNRGLAEAKTPIVAFTDDDARVDPQWAGVVGRFFARNPEASALTGLVIPLELCTEAQWRFEDYLGFGRGFERNWHFAPGPGPIAAKHGNTGRLGTGANMAFRRAALEAVGGFDPALDAGTTTGGGGDLESFFRILKAGGLLGYEPAAVVRHRHRRSVEGLAQQIRSWGTGMGAYLASIATAFPDEARAAAALRRRLLLTWFPRRLLDSSIRRRHRHALVRAEIGGLLEGPRLYAQAVRGAAGTRPFARLHPVPAGRRNTGITVDAGSPVRTVRDLGDAGAARIRVMYNGKLVGTLDVPVIAGCIGADRLTDAMARAFGPRLLGQPVRTTGRRLRQVLVSEPIE